LEGVVGTLRHGLFLATDRQGRCLDVFGFPVEHKDGHNQMIEIKLNVACHVAQQGIFSLVFVEIGGNVNDQTPLAQGGQVNWRNVARATQVTIQVADSHD